MSQLMKAKIGQQKRPYKEGGKVIKEEIAVFKKAGRPDLVKHEKAEAKMKKGGRCCA